MSIINDANAVEKSYTVEFESIEAQKLWEKEALVEEWNRGFYMAKIDSRVLSKDSTSIELLKGDVLQVDELSLNAIDKRWQNVLFRYFELKNLVFNEANIGKLMTEALGYFEENGYPFAKIWLTNIEFTNSGLKADLNLDEGLYFTFQKFDIDESVKISESFLTKFLGFKKGEAFNYKKAIKIEDAISSLPYLKVRRAPFVSYSDEGRVRIYLDLENVQVSSFDGIVGVAPQSKVDGGTLFTGQFDFKLRNPLARGIGFDMAFEKFQENSQKLNTRLEYPFILSTSLGFDFSFDLLKADTNYMNLTTRLGFAYFFSGNSKLGAFYNQFRAYPLASQIGENVYQNLTTHNYGLNYKGSQLDYLPNPLKGFNAFFEASIGRKEFANEEQMNTTIAQAQHKVEFFIPLAKKLTFLLRSNGQFVLDPSFSQNQVLWIGGLKSLRGFNEGAIPAKNYVQQTLELRYLVDRNSHAKVFYDLARVQQFNAQNELVASWFSGFGAGYNFRTGPGIFTINYAIGQDNNSQISLTDGKVHFGFLSYF